MRFSEFYGIDKSADHDWFDPLLGEDTRLFVDPFLMFLETEGAWAGAHPRLISFFNMVLQLLAQAGTDPNRPQRKAAERLLLFPEPAEFCLGFAEGSPIGSGAGRGLQRGMVEGALTGIGLGIVAVEHFEELTLFEVGIGADRISDIVCNVLKAEFIQYTQEVAEQHSIDCDEHRVPHASWNEAARRWEDRVVRLPTNPYTKLSVLLLPSRFLRRLPTVDPSDFWEWAWTNKNEDLRGQFNFELASRVDGETIARMARAKPHIVKEYMEWLEHHPKNPYNVERDPDGEVLWYEQGKHIAALLPPPTLPSEPGQFCDFVETLLAAFVHTVVDQDGWMLLWGGDRPRSERIVQALFRAVMTSYCRAHDIDLSGEANAGRGPADFKFSAGWSRRALVEVKLTNNTKFWHGLQQQLPTYMSAEDIQCGFFVSVGFSDADFSPERKVNVTAAADAVSKQLGISVRVVSIDARRKNTASKT